MLRKRILFTLVYNGGFFMQSRNFRLQKVGDLNWLERNYHFQKIAFSLDELIVLNATRKDKSIKEFSETVRDLVNGVFIPVAAGGGIRSVEDAEILFKSGADKIVINSALIDNRLLVTELVKRYGSQSIVASVDYKSYESTNEVYIRDGTHKIKYSLEEYLPYIESLEVGEVYLNSIDKDGTGFGYDFRTIQGLENLVNLPLIIAGGAGNESHFIEGLNTNSVSAVATANLFNFIGDGLPNARKKVIEAGANIAVWA